MTSPRQMPIHAVRRDSVDMQTVAIVVGRGPVGLASSRCSRRCPQGRRRQLRLGQPAARRDLWSTPRRRPRDRFALRRRLGQGLLHRARRSHGFRSRPLRRVGRTADHLSRRSVGTVPKHGRADRHAEIEAVARDHATWSSRSPLVATTRSVSVASTDTPLSGTAARARELAPPPSAWSPIKSLVGSTKF